jgi:hypothetical protein
MYLVAVGAERKPYGIRGDPFNASRRFYFTSVKKPKLLRRNTVNITVFRVTGAIKTVYSLLGRLTASTFGGKQKLINVRLRSARAEKYSADRYHRQQKRYKEYLFHRKFLPISAAKFHFDRTRNPSNAIFGVIFLSCTDPAPLRTPHLRKSALFSESCKLF